MADLETARSLAMLALQDEEIAPAQNTLDRLDALAKHLPTEKLREGCLCPDALHLRPDCPCPSLAPEELLRNAPSRKNGCIPTPAAFAEDGDGNPA